MSMNSTTTTGPVPVEIGTPTCATCGAPVARLVTVEILAGPAPYVHVSTSAWLDAPHVAVLSEAVAA